MEWKDKILGCAVLLFAIAVVLEVIDIWQVLVSHLTLANWTTLAASHGAVFGIISVLYTSVVKGERIKRGEIYLVGALVLMTWAVDFSLIEKVVGR